MEVDLVLFERMSIGRGEWDVRATVFADRKMSQDGTIAFQSPLDLAISMKGAATVFKDFWDEICGWFSEQQAFPFEAFAAYVNYYAELPDGISIQDVTMLPDRS